MHPAGASLERVTGGSGPAGRRLEDIHRLWKVRLTRTFAEIGCKKTEAQHQEMRVVPETRCGECGITTAGRDGAEPRMKRASEAGDGCSFPLL